MQLLGSNFQGSSYLEVQAVWQRAKGRAFQGDLIKNEPSLISPTKKTHQKLNLQTPQISWNKMHGKCPRASETKHCICLRWNTHITSSRAILESFPPKEMTSQV